MSPGPLDPTILSLLAEIDDEAELSSLLGVDLSPAGPSASHAPSTYPPLDEWLRRSEEVHRFLRAAKRAEREGRGR
ncbi:MULTISPECIES: hypothetical protein [Sorangium]|uniref:Uncharacterized protein n=1 Tax=Sorangium cellulosum TaxID=56 RepID=A0A4P2R4K3_SORCE|nr:MULTISPECIES: hypothetical protein [Sorangium]AUX37696.1 uncharacterized protein SOCE836_099260 [Sorangium cellulosum]WCQ96984.1 hypothetical protein NQZ70_09774 [Sorangium sp. Soce836]